MRVVIQHFGLPRYRLAVFRALAAVDGIDLKVVYGRAPGLANVEPAGFVGEPAPLRTINTPLGYFGWDSSQWRHARRSAADVLILTWNTRFLSLIPALARARRRGVRTLLWGHGYSRREARWRRGLRRAAATVADGVIFYGRRDAERFVAATDRRESTFVVTNSLDQGPIQEARERLLADPEALERFRLDNDLEGRRVLLFVSRYKPENRLELLLDAAGRLVVEYPQLAVVVIGDGTASRPELQDVVARPSLGEVVRFVGPLYDEDRLAAWFLSAEVFAYPSNLGLSVLHAFGYGLPVVTGSAGERNPPEWQAIVDGGNGLLFEDGDAGSLAATIGRLLEDDALRQRLGDEARRTALEDYTLDGMVGGLTAAIEYCRSL